MPRQRPVTTSSCVSLNYYSGFPWLVLSSLCRFLSLLACLPSYQCTSLCVMSPPACTLLLTCLGTVLVFSAEAAVHDVNNPLEGNGSLGDICGEHCLAGPGWSRLKHSCLLVAWERGIQWQYNQLRSLRSAAFQAAEAPDTLCSKRLPPPLCNSRSSFQCSKQQTLSAQPTKQTREQGGRGVSNKKLSLSSTLQRQLQRNGSNTAVAASTKEGIPGQRWKSSGGDASNGVIKRGN